jgi:hypothetical protein
LRGLPKQEISGVEEKEFLSFFPELVDERRFLGDTAKRIPESPAGLNFTHHIIGVDDAPLNFGCCRDGGKIKQVQGQRNG